MDIFVRNIPAHSTNKQLERLLEGPLKECGVTGYDVDNWKSKPQAKVTVLNAAAGQRFLQTYGVARGAPSYAHGLKPLRWDGVFVQCSQDRNGPSAFALKSLAYSAAQKAASVPGKASTQQKEGGGRVTRFRLISNEVAVPKSRYFFRPPCARGVARQADFEGFQFCAESVSKVPWMV